MSQISLVFLPNGANLVLDYLENSLTNPQNAQKVYSLSLLIQATCNLFLFYVMKIHI